MVSLRRMGIQLFSLDGIILIEYEIPDAIDSMEKCRLKKKSGIQLLVRDNAGLFPLWSFTGDTWHAI